MNKPLKYLQTQITILFSDSVTETEEVGASSSSSGDCELAVANLSISTSRCGDTVVTTDSHSSSDLAISPQVVHTSPLPTTSSSYYSQTTESMAAVSTATVHNFHGVQSSNNGTRDVITGLPSFPTDNSKAALYTDIISSSNNPIPVGKFQRYTQLYHSPSLSLAFLFFF